MSPADTGDTIIDTTIRSKNLIWLCLLFSVASSTLPAAAQSENSLPLRDRISPLAPPQSTHQAGSEPIHNLDNSNNKPLAAIIGRDIDFDIYPARAPSVKMKALHVRVRNRSDEPLIFDGDHTSIALREGGARTLAISQHELDAVNRPPTTLKGKFSSDVKATVTAAVSVGMVQTIDTLKREYGPIEKRYEYDEQRRTNEESRFGQRLLYPGDSTDGNIYFSATTSFEGQMLSIPVKSFYDKTDQSSITKIIQSTN